MAKKIQKKIMQTNLNDIISAMKSQGFDVFDDDSKPLNLNIVGIRSKDMTPNTFNDELHVFWKFRGKWSHLVFSFTTDPGLYWLENPMNPNGTIIMVAPQQINGAYKNGFHRGSPALEQVEEMQYWRDNNRDSLFDIGGDVYKEDASTNLHKAGEDSFVVGKWSAGCQVVANEEDFSTLLYITKKAAEYWGNSFTYTLLHENNL